MAVGFLELAVTGASTAFVAGAMGSLHCALMCGPLACAGLSREGAARKHTMMAWQVGRVLAYGAVGLGLGGSGRWVSEHLSVSVEPYLPWVMAVGLIATAFEFAQHVAPLPGVARLARGLMRVSAKVGPRSRAALMGAATPFLPCGLLYGVFFAAIASGTGVGGAMVMSGFALGGVPALAGAQLGASAGLARWPRATRVLRRVVPLIAALVLMYRALNASGGAAATCH